MQTAISSKVLPSGPFQQSIDSNPTLLYSIIPWDDSANLIRIWSEVQNRQIDFLDSLKEVHDKVQHILLSDSFTENIVPHFMRNGVLAYPSRSGKGLRPALLMWACGLFDECIEKTEKIAAGIEMFHTWTLVHDDIIDDDDIRRGEPTVHTQIGDYLLNNGRSLDLARAKKYGSDFAILCGDIQQAWANKLILDSVNDGVDSDIVLSISRRLNTAVTPGVIIGQAIDVELSLLPISEIEPDRIESMLMLKTGVLFRFAAECGALIGLGTTDFGDTRVTAIGEFAEKAALAFQLKDDLLGTLGDQESLGKPIGSDLREGKRTLLYTTAVKMLGDSDKEHFLNCLGNAELSNDEYRKVCGYLRECGAIDKIENRIRNLLTKAGDLLDMAPDNVYKQLLREWTRFIHTRNH